MSKQWKYNGGTLEVVNADGRAVAQCVSRKEGVLMAAAPDMYACLKALDSTAPHDFEVMLQKTLAKAEGK